MKLIQMKKYVMVYTTMLFIFIAGCSLQNQEINLVSPSKKAKKMTVGSYYELVLMKMSGVAKCSKGGSG